MYIEEVIGIFNVKMKFANIRRNTRGVSVFPLNIDIDRLKCGDQKGFDTLVVYTVNDGY